MDRQTDRKKDRQTHGRQDIWMDGRMDRSFYLYTEKYKQKISTNVKRITIINAK